MKKRGFTLIEIMIAIAIIGLLSSIILVSFKNTKDSARDSRIITSLDQIRSIVQIFYAKENTYENIEGDSYFIFLKKDIEDLSGEEPVVHTGRNGIGYCFYTKLHNGDYCCIDSNLYYKCYASDALFDFNCQNDNNKYQCDH
jgi:prepilin-type N-terminal cleavage/methylation domain-containing protein